MAKGIRSLLNLLIATLIVFALGTIKKVYAFDNTLIGMDKEMSISQNGINFIKKHEGFRSCRYQDAAGVWTIGYGHTGWAAKKYECIKERFAEKLLRDDITTAERAVNRNIDYTMFQYEYDALVSFAFNVGESAFARSKLVKLFNMGNDRAAANQLKRWVYAGGRVNEGLKKRREAERLMFLGRRYD